MTELIELDIGFENCEVISFSAKEVASIDIDEITKEIHKVWRSNHIRKNYKSADVVLVFPPEANRRLKESTVFERIHNNKDIIDITIVDSGDVYCTTVAWDNSDNLANRFQTSAFLSDGSLVVVISKERNATQLKAEIDRKIQEIDEIDRIG